MRRIFNHPLNRYGYLCKVFLGTAAAAEGISLKNVRQVHIMEPYWNEVRIQQVIGRARRICSHIDLDESDRNIYVYRYHMILTPDQQKLLGETLSTDQAIYEIASRKKQINEQFLQVLKDGSVDCYLNYQHNNTTNNPIKCFSFGVGETGVDAFKTAIEEEKKDIETMILYKYISVPYKVIGKTHNDEEILIKMDPKGNEIVEKIVFKRDPKKIQHEGVVSYYLLSDQFIPIEVRWIDPKTKKMLTIGAEHFDLV